MSTGFFPGEKYPVKSNPETSDFQHFSEDMCRSEECRLLHRSCSVLNSQLLQVACQLLWHWTQCTYYHWHHVCPWFPDPFNLSCQVLVLFILFSFFLPYVAISGNSYVGLHNDCFLCLLFLNYNVWPPVMDFTVCLDGKVPQQFYFLILFYAFGGMLIPFVTALNSISLAQLPMYDPPNNIMSLVIFCLRKLGATTLHKICCTVSSWLPHILHLDDIFWFSILAFTAFVLSAWSCAAKISSSVSFFS